MKTSIKTILASILGIILVPTLVWGVSVTWNKIIAGQIYPPLVGDKVSIGTTTPSAQLTVWSPLSNIFNVVNNASTTLLSVSGTGFGTTTLTGLNINGSATSTSNVGWNLTAGCFAVNGTCISGSGAVGASKWATSSAESNLIYPAGAAKVNVGTTTSTNLGIFNTILSGATTTNSTITSFGDYYTDTGFSDKLQLNINAPIRSLWLTTRKDETSALKDFAPHNYYGFALEQIGDNYYPNAVSASADAHGICDYGADRAFNGGYDYPTCGAGWWSFATLPAWIKLDIGAGNTKILNTYGISSFDGGTSAIKDWTVEGSNDDTNWTVIDTVTGNTWSEPQTKFFGVDDISTAYRYFRVNVSAVQSAAGAWINELYFYATSTETTAPPLILGAGQQQTLTITPQARVGIGTRIPAALLQISGSATSTYGGGVDLFKVSTSTGAAYFIINKGGNIGIGTTTPGSILSLGDTGANTINIYTTATSTFGTGINLRTGCFAIAGTCVGGAAGGGGTDPFTHPLLGLSASTSQFIFGTSTAGNYGLTIATSTAPQLSLSDGAGVAQWVARNAGGNLYFSTTTIAGTATSSIAALQIDTSGVSTPYPVSIGNFSGGSNYGSFQVKGRSTLGTTTGSQLLSVSGAVIGGDNSVSQLALTSGAGYGFWAFRNSFGNLYLATTTVSGIGTTSIPALTIDTNGKMGVASATPFAKLSVQQEAGENAFVIGSSTKTVLMMNELGELLIGGNSHAANGSHVDIISTYTDATSKRGINNYFNPTYNTNTSGTNYVLYNYADIRGTANVPTFYGTYNNVRQGSSGNSNAVYGVFNEVANGSTGTITSAFGIENFVANYGTGTILNAYGQFDQLYNDTPEAMIVNGYGLYTARPSGGTFGNVYGAYIENHAGVGTTTNSYNLFSAGATSTNVFQGSVGIGTTTPTGKLEVHGTDSLSTNALAVQLGVYNSQAAQVDRGGVIAMGGAVSNTATTTFAAIKGQKENATAGNTSGYLSIFTRSDGAALTTERARFTSVGALGIGTTTPPAQLTISTTTALVANSPMLLIGSSTLTSPSANGTYIAINAPTGFSGNFMDFQLNGAARFSVNSVGNVVSNNSISGVSLSASANVSANSINSSGNNVALTFNARNSSTANIYGFLFKDLSGTASTPTSGTSGHIAFQNQFAPTSGTAEFDEIKFSQIFNQTGTASGITRTLHLAPFLTRTADYRNFEIDYASTTMNGNLTNAYNVRFGQLDYSSSTASTITNASGLSITGAPAAGNNVTISTSTALLIEASTTNSGGTITNAYGAIINSAVGATNNYALLTSGKNLMYGLTTAAGTPSSLCMNAATGEVVVNAALTCTVSDEDQKTELMPLNFSALDLIDRLSPSQFYYKDNPDRLRYGFGAQTLQRVSPQLADGYDSGGTAHSIDLPALTALNTKAIQELNDKVKEIDTGGTFEGAIKSGAEQWQWMVIIALAVWVTFLEIRIRRK